MADRLISGGASSSSDEYEEDEEGEGAGENDTHLVIKHTMDNRRQCGSEYFI